MQGSGNQATLVNGSCSCRSWWVRCHYPMAPGVQLRSLDCEASQHKAASAKSKSLVLSAMADATSAKR
jgi:hypothetical protein